MGFFNNLFRHQDISPPQSITLDENSSEKPVHVKSEKSIVSAKNFFAKFSTFLKSISDRREQIIAPEFDFYDIYRASVNDSYVKMALSKYKSLLFKAGYQLKGENDEAIDYIKKRFKIFSITCGKPIDILFQEIGNDLVTYGNAFVIKSRSDKLDLPGVKASGIFDDRVVTGYFRIDPCCVYIKKSKHGSIEKYIYRINGDEQLFSPKDVIHFYIDKDPNNNYGTPMIIAALEDVKLLRRVEGNVVALIYRFAMPIYHWICGLPQDGKGATQNEIDELRDTISNMDIDGCIVTNERTDVKTIGAEGSALDSTGYLGYFEKRVFSALGVSDSQMGRGGSKQDADSMESQMHDAIKHFQRHISIFVENYMITELLLEGGFDPISNSSDCVYYVFNEISLETKIKVENHELAKFQANMITFDESRREIGLRSDNVDIDRLYCNMITNESAIQQIEAKTDGEIEVAKLTSKLNAQNNQNNNNSSSKTSTIKGNGKQTSAKNASNGTVSSINTPSNQHGKTSVKIKESLDSSNHVSEKRLFIHRKFNDIYDFYQKIKEETVINKSDLRLIFNVTTNKLNESLTKILTEEFKNGSAKIDQGLIPYNETKLYDLIEMKNKSINKLMQDIKNCVIALDSDDEIRNVFDKYEYRIDYIISYYVLKAHNLGYVSKANMCNIKEVYVNYHSDIDKENHKNDVINTSYYTLDDIPAYHPFCECTLCIERGAEQ